MLKLMAYVGVAIEGRDEPLMLSTRALVDNHAKDWETLALVEKAMLEYNVSFFGKGASSLSLEGILRKAAPLISQMLTALREQSSPPDTPPS